MRMPTLADRLASGEENEFEWDPAYLEPEEEPPDELDPESFATMMAESDEWLRGPEAAGQGWPLDSGPRAPGAAGPDLVNAARDAAVSDDLSQLDDAELVGQAQASRDLASRALGRMYRTLGELLRRRPPRKKNGRLDAREQVRGEDESPGAGAPHRPQMPAMASEEAAGEIALALTLTYYAAEKLTEITSDLARRLPRALEEMEAGRLDNDKVKILWEYTRDLSDASAAKLDAALAPRAAGMTTGELRDRARREQIRIDPDAADKRRKRNERQSRVVLYANDDHTANLAVENAPAELAAAAKGRVNAIARAAKASGAKEELSLLESKTFLGLLLGTLEAIPPPVPPDDSPGDWPDGPGDHPDGPDDWPDGPGPGGDNGAGGNPGGGPVDPGEPRDGESMPWPRIPDTADASAPGCAVIPPGFRPRNPGRLRLAAPWRTLTGMAGEPGDLSWFGAVTPGQTRDLARAAAADPTAVWRVIVTDDDGRAIAVAALGHCSSTLGHRSSTGGTAPGLVGEVTVTIQASLAAALDGDDEMREVARRLTAGADPRLTRRLLDVITAANTAAAAAETQAILDAQAGGCAHSAEVPGYRVPDTMRRRLCARDFTCRNPRCRRRGTQCDIDHTLAYDKGGRTCTCNTGPLCRAHHRLKQAPGWHLTQEPGTGIFTWTTPAGLTYREEPHRYPV